MYDINEVKILERFGNKRMTTEQCALPELSIDIRVGVRIGDRGQPDTLVPLAVVYRYHVSNEKMSTVVPKSLCLQSIFLQFFQGEKLRRRCFPPAQSRSHPIWWLVKNGDTLSDQRPAP